MTPISPGARRALRARLPVRPPLSPITAALLAGLCLHGAARAQTTTPTPAPATVVVTGNPLATEALAQPSAVLTGDALALRRAGTLGDTLSGLPGVAASGFGPQASRPVIRGLDGDRIRLLDNGGASADASNLSFDHAVAVDPLVVERIEVLRGPAALLYGGNATGGVVNALDNRIPREPLSGLGGRADLRLGGAARERAGAAVLEGGADGLNWHVDAAHRLSEDQRTPRFTPVAADGQPLPAARQVANSAGDSRAAALGASWADARGYLGLALDGLRNDYGVAVEPDVQIHLQRDRLQLAGERRALGGLIDSVSAQASHTRYQHAEVAASGVVGTTFSSLGSDLRLQANTAPLALAGGTLHGVLGAQAEWLDFSALGDEAFVPSTHSRSQALFTLQTLSLPGGASLSAGLRLERAVVQSDGDVAGAAVPRFGAPDQRRFAPRSASLGALLPLAGWGPGWSASATLGSTQRAPAYYELYANGAHVATGAWERGDAQQALERSRHAELGLQWHHDGHSLRAAVFDTRFANYIALDASGVQVPDGAGGSLPEYRFTGVPARLQGLEIEGKRRLTRDPWQLDASASLDWLRGDNRASGQPLPRIAPLRLQAGLDLARGDWRGGVQLQHRARQDRVPANDIATPAATLVDLWAGWQQRLAGADALWTLKLSNLGNALAYNASAVRTARELAPAGARALSAGLRLSF